VDEKIILSLLAIFGGLITFLQKVLYQQGKNNYEIVVKLIDRFNKSDDRIEQIADDLAESADRRYERQQEAINDVRDDLNWIKGKMDGK
jgi:hypothetical protein